jgi:hypothetical protein
MVTSDAAGTFLQVTTAGDAAVPSGPVKSTDRSCILTGCRHNRRTTIGQSRALQRREMHRMTVIDTVIDRSWGKDMMSRPQVATPDTLDAFSGP